MTDIKPEDGFWINDARRELKLTVRRSDVWAEGCKGPMCEIISRHLDSMSTSLGNLELVYLRTKQHRDD